MSEEICHPKNYTEPTTFYRRNQNATLPFGKTLAEMNETDDWGNSIYFALTEKGAEGYDDKDHPYKMEVRNTAELRRIVCTDECFKQGHYEDRMSAIIAATQNLVKKNMPAGMPFMKWLGSEGYAFQCYNNPDGDMELIVPLNLLQADRWEITQAERV